MLGWCVLLPLLVAVVLHLVGFEGLQEERSPELTATATCGYLENRHGLKPGRTVRGYPLRSCLAAGRGSEVWLAQKEGGEPVAVKVLKFAGDVAKLREACDAFQRLRLDGAARVPSCIDDGVLDFRGSLRAYSIRTLASGRRLDSLLEEAKVAKLPAEISRLSYALEAVLSIFEVLDSGVRSCLPEGGRNCTYYVEVSPQNVVLTVDGRSVVVDFDVLGPGRYLTYADQTSLFPPYLSLDERLQECLTRSLLYTLLRCLYAGAEGRGPLPGPVLQLMVNLLWRGSKLDHCRNQHLTDDELAAKAAFQVSADWPTDKRPEYSGRRRPPRGLEAQQVSLLTTLLPEEYREDWRKLPGAAGALVDAIVGVRDWEVSWPPKLIGHVRRWLELLGGRRAGVASTSPP